MNTENMNKLREMIQRHEGLRLSPYKDIVGFWTIGFGHNLSTKNEPIPEIITLTKAEFYFEDDLEHALCSLDVTLKAYGIDVDEVRFAALTDLVFNIGIYGMLKFKKMLAALLVSDYTVAAAELLNSKYAKQVGGRANELADMLLTGEWAK